MYIIIKSYVIQYENSNLLRPIIPEGMQKGNGEDNAGDVYTAFHNNVPKYGGAA
jgi:hypothetical protein